MKYLYEELPAVEVAGTKLVGRMLFSLLVLASALIGACVGLLIVYSTDLPEVSQLENYRPSAITEIYDDKGREVGSFAIQRRVIVSYDELPKGLRDALLSTEDKDLRLDEAAVLAGLPKSPTEFDPIVHPERALGRRNTVINSMLEDGKITAAEAARLKSLPLKLNVSVPVNNLAPWFVEDIRRYLERKYGSDQVHQG